MTDAPPVIAGTSSPVARSPRGFLDWGYLLGPIAGIYAWIVILISAYLNPWWSLTSQAFSYLGASGPNDPYPWVYNYVGMVPSGLLILAFSYYLYRISRNRTEKIGSLHLTLAALLLVGIGIWHQGPGPYPPGTSADLGQNLHDLFSAWFFLQALLAGLTWGVGLRKEQRRPLGLAMIGTPLGAWAVAIGFAIALGSLFGASAPHKLLLQHAGEGGMAVGIPIALVGAYLAVRGSPGSRRESWGFYILLIGALLAGIGVIAGFGSIPGAVGEAIGILAIDAWVLLLFFAREERTVEGLEPGETVEVQAHRSVIDALQPRALLYAAVGLVLFYFGYHYLTSQVVPIIEASGSAQVHLIVQVAVVTLISYFVGFALVVAGSLRWRRAVPAGVGRVLTLLTLVPPLVMVFTWFNALGVELMLLYLFTVGTLLPLAFSLHAWRITPYVVTVRRILGAGEPLPLTGVRSVSVHQGWLERRLGVGTLAFHHDHYRPKSEPGAPTGRVTWRGVTGPWLHLHEARERMGLAEVAPRRATGTRLHAGLTVAIFIPLLLVATFVPVFAVTNTQNIPCAAVTSGTKIISNPWPYIYNVTIPPGHTTFRWTSGSPVYVLVLEIPPAVAKQNTNVSSLGPGQGLSLTQGAGSYDSYGGSSSVLCVSLTSGTTITMSFSYAAPLLWE